MEQGRSQKAVTTSSNGTRARGGHADRISTAIHNDGPEWVSGFHPPLAAGVRSALRCDNVRRAVETDVCAGGSRVRKQAVCTAAGLVENARRARGRTVHVFRRRQGVANTIRAQSPWRAHRQL